MPSLPDRLGAHAAIGDGRTAALVAANGDIDWFAPTGLDAAPACFALIHEGGGSIRLGPTRPDWSGSQWLPTDEAPIVTTSFETPDGRAEVQDHLTRGRIVRTLTILAGTFDAVLAVTPGHEFGVPRRVERWSNGIAFGAVRIEGVEPDRPMRLHAGEHRVITVSAMRDLGVTRLGPERHHPTLGEAVRERDELRRHWTRDLAEAETPGRHRAAVIRSIRALRLLGDMGADGAAIIRALTTSVPARAGNERNVDERFAWLRDNAHAVRGWDRLGFRNRAAAHRQWLHDRAGDDLPLAPAYRSDGERPRAEEELSLSGWGRNGPVRSGQPSRLVDLGAIAELSLVLDDRRSWSSLERIGDWLAAHALEPDTGRWDERSRTRRHVESVLAARTALTALVATARRRNPLDPVTLHWTDALKAIDTWLRVEGRFGRGASAGWRRVGGTLADDSSDASILRWIPGDPIRLGDDVPGEERDRLRSTARQAMHQLSEGAFVHRHLAHVDDGFPPGQGADLWASFTAVSALAAVERWEEAHERMDALLSALGPTHLGATHIDPITGDLRGNLGAAPMHLALIDAALDLERGPS